MLPYLLIAAPVTFLILFFLLKKILNHPKRKRMEKCYKYEVFTGPNKTEERLSHTYSNWRLELSQLIRSEVPNLKLPSERVFKEFYAKCYLPSEVLKELNPPKLTNKAA